MQMSYPIDVIISVINWSMNSFQFNSYTVVFSAKYPHSKHFNFKHLAILILKKDNHFDHVIPYLAKRT